MSKKILYLAEKPDIAKYLAKGLGGGKSIDGGIEGDQWIITWAYGHLLQTFEPEDYNDANKAWSWNTLPIIPDKIRFKPMEGPMKARAAKQLSAIKRLAKQAHTIIIATDPDREGELIAYTILNNIQWKGETKRLWLTDTSPVGVKSALASLKQASETKPMYFAAMSRTYADWLVGMNLTRAATIKLNSGGQGALSVGRVQTPVLALFVDRERKITNFKPENYFELIANVQTANGSLKMRFAPKEENRIKDRNKIIQLQSTAMGATGPIGVKTEAKKQGPPSLFDLTLLQQECNAKFGWSANKTLELAQSLYDTHHYLTYPRTDCRALPEEHISNIPTIASNLSSIDQFSHLLTPATQTNMAKTLRKSVYDDKKVTAHFAIIPTSMKPNIGSLSNDEAKLYLLVAKHYIAAHLPDMEYLQTTVNFSANEIPFKASGRQITHNGWKDAFVSLGTQKQEQNDDDEPINKNDNPTLPPLKNGETARANNVTIDDKQTQAPKRFTEKTLLSAMSGIASFVDDPKAKQILKETSGIGTPATRANIIETLKKRNYVRMEKKTIKPTDIGFALIDTIKTAIPNYANPVMTAQWEDVLETIAKGNNIPLIKKFIDGISNTITKDLQTLKDGDFKHLSNKLPKTNRKSSNGTNSDWKKRILNGTPINVKFEDNPKASKLGARWCPEKKSMMIPEGVDPEPFKKGGWLK